MYPENIRFSVKGYTPELGAGRVMFVDASQNVCDESSAFTIFSLEETSPSKVVPANEVLQVEVKAGGNINAETYKVCYKHGEEDAYLMYPFTFTMLVANNVTVSHGSSSLFVVDPVSYTHLTLRRH